MALTRITKGVIKPNENYDTHNINSTGIVTATGLDISGNASIGGVLTYEDVTSIDSVGIITARAGVVSPNADIDDFISVGNNIQLGNAGVITATAADIDDFVSVGNNIQLGNAGIITATAADIDDFLDVGSNIKLGNAGVITATSFSGSGANLTGISAPLSFRNIAINGAMNIAQRGTQSTASNGYHTVDRWSQDHGSTDEAPTFQQFDVSPPSSPYHLPTSGDHPYREGFRKAWGVTNGNQTSGAGADDNIIMGYAFEAQDIANSGWDYTNPNSDITLSFWIKSSVSQEFFGQLLAMDGTVYNYPFGTGVLTAFTWTKVVKTIPGNANLTINNDNGVGLRFYLWPFAGTNLTGNITNDAWMVNNYSTRVANNTTTWYTTNDASLQITGFQLEVGSSATTFEHRRPDEELKRCKRYCHVLSHAGYSLLGIGMQYYSGYIFIDAGPIDMRVTPTMTAKTSSAGAYTYEKIFGNSAEYIHTIALDGKTTREHAVLNMSGDASRQGQAVRCSAHYHNLVNNESFMYLDAEL